jgi:hypothetical protein
MTMSMVLLLGGLVGVLLGSAWTVQAIEKTFRQQAKERRRLNTALVALRASLQQQDQDPAHDHLQGGIAVAHSSDSPSLLSSANTESDPLVQKTFPITICASDESAYKQVETAVEDLLTTAGGHPEHQNDPGCGSLFHGMQAKISNIAILRLATKVKL